MLPCPDTPCQDDQKIKMKLKECFTLQDLPDTVLEQTLLMFSYHEISQLRRVSKRFNTICRGLLNKGFRSADNYQKKYFHEVKAQLPRRESNRLNHKLSEHFELLGRIETQFSMLKQAFLKYIDSGRCCFIPGKVIDEALFVLRRLKAEENPSHEIIQELRELRDMAIEHFPSMNSQLPLPLDEPTWRYSSEIPREASYGSGGSKNIFPEGTSEPRGERRMENENKKMIQMENQIRNQNEIIKQQNNRITEMEKKWAEMNRTLQSISIGQGGGRRKKKTDRKIQGNFLQLEGRVTRSRNY